MILPLPPCPGKDDVVRRYEVAAVQTDLVYNRYGDHDPDGLIFVPLEDVDLVLAGKYTPKPLILRANVGDWLEVILHNVWDPNRPVPYFDYPRVPVDLKHKPSNRVSLNPQFLQYEPVDPEDTGEKGYNYRSERFANRLLRDARVWKVFSSRVHGDPATPVWKAYSGDRVIFRTMMPADKPRNVSLTIHGHLWREQPKDALSREIPIQGGESVSEIGLIWT